MHRFVSESTRTLGKFIGRVTFYGTLGSVTAVVLNTIGCRCQRCSHNHRCRGFAIVSGFQGTLSNFAAGCVLLLLVFRPFKVGKSINVAGMIGKVNEIDLFTTTLDTPDNRRIILPNSSISGGTIENINPSPHPTSRSHRRLSRITVTSMQPVRHFRPQCSLAGELIVPGETRGSQSSSRRLPTVLCSGKFVLGSTQGLLRGYRRVNVCVKSELDRAKLQIPFHTWIFIFISRCD